jgi:hypothetical protein
MDVAGEFCQNFVFASERLVDLRDFNQIKALGPML